MAQAKAGDKVRVHFTGLLKDGTIGGLSKLTLEDQWGVTMSTDRELFWLTKSLTEMTLEEWESLCDGCGRCCLYKVQFRDTDEVYYTNVACRYLDARQCRCTSYEQRTRLVPHCLVLTPANAGKLQWLPTTCAYRRLALGMRLEWWHPLVSGDPNTVRKSGISVRGKVVPEECVNLDQLQGYIFYW